MEILFWGLAAAALLYVVWRAFKWAVEATGRAPMNDD
jgi:hypothetical protein